MCKFNLYMYFFEMSSINKNCCLNLHTSEQAANYSVVGNCILVNVQICNKEKKISNFPLYASLHLIYEDFSYHSIARWLSLKSHAILYDKDIVKRKCHRNVRAFHPIS